jgi:hypothetical protein
MSGSASASKNSGWSKENSQYSGQTSSTSNPLISEEWLNQNQAIANLLGATGVTAGQQANINALQNLNVGQGAYTQAGYYGLDQFADRFGGGWAAPTDVTSQTVNAQSVVAPNVSAQSGAQNMSAYANPWQRDVVNATVDDYNINTDRTLNAMRAARDSAGAFGDRAAVADAVYLGDASRGLGSLVGNLNSQGFNTAAALGQQDANRYLSADSTNAAHQLTASQANAANALNAQQFNAGQSQAAQEFNNNLRNNRQQFDINAAFQGDQNRMQAFRDQQTNLLSQSGIMQGGLDNLLQQLSLGTSTFGNQTDTTASGQSSSSSQSGSKSKGGGISGSLP